jgi:hypothetical protein
MKHITTLFLVLLPTSIAFSQNYSGTILCMENHRPIAYANTGILGKGIGTVSNSHGHFKLDLNNLSDLDTLMISCIGYHPEKILLGDFKKESHHTIFLKQHIIELDEVTVRPLSLKTSNLGNRTRSRSIKAGFKENQLGYEMGVMMKVKRPVFVEQININIAETSYDTLFYRLNIYNVSGNSEFSNILSVPIYIQIPREQLNESIQVDLREHNLRFENDFLVTLEHIKEMGPGYLNFCASLRGRVYHRKTSHATWESTPIGIGINVDVLEELR